MEREEGGALIARCEALALIMESPWQKCPTDLQRAGPRSAPRTCFSSLLLSVPLTLHRSLSCSPHTAALAPVPSSSFYPALCACHLFIERFGRGIRAFRPKITHTHARAHPGFFILCPHQDLRSPRAESFYSRQKIHSLEREAALQRWRLEVKVLEDPSSLRPSWIHSPPL